VPKDDHIVEALSRIHGPRVLMNGRQYQQLVANRQNPVIAPLFDGRSHDAMLRRAARSLKRRQRIERLLADVLPSQIGRCISEVAFSGGTLWLLADDPVVSERLQSEAAGITREIRRQVPELQRIRVTRSEHGRRHANIEAPLQGRMKQP